MTRSHALLLGLATVAAAGCRESTAPAGVNVEIRVAAGDGQFGVPATNLADPLQVMVTNAITRKPVKNVPVTWRIVQGNGASVTPIRATTDGEGVASAQLRLGPDTGSYRVEASAPQAVAGPAGFTARGVPAPIIEAVSPTTVSALDTITILGRNFRSAVDQNTVLFGGLRGRVLTATATRITAEVPLCVLTRAVELRVLLGSVASDPSLIQTRAGQASDLELSRGQSLLLSDPRDLSCLSFPAGQPNVSFLVVPQNATSVIDVPMRYELLGFTGGGPIITAPTPSASIVHRSYASDWELRLRARERVIAGTGGITGEADRIHAAAAVDLGDRRAFNVLRSDDKTDRITAEVKTITRHAIIYVDLNAPANGLTTADLQRFGDIFDDPIYTTDVSVYGTPSDIDGNGKIIIVLTPAVNALTARTDDSFIAGYFYGCDLVEASRCAETNRGEIFYSMVPDPDAQFSGRRTKDTVLRTVPGVLAHEFQHMINFAEKSQRLDVLWLSEALAHMAEELVGKVFLARGDVATAADFRNANFIRARQYLNVPEFISLISEDSPGTLEMRGGAWLLVQYAMGLYGGDALLGRLTKSTRFGTDNIATETGRAWRTLLAEFALALWADEAPDLAGVTVDPRLTFVGFDLRSGLGGFPLRPTTVNFQDFLTQGELPSASQEYFIVQAPTGGSGQPFHLTFSGPLGGPFLATSAPQVAILRIR